MPEKTYINLDSLNSQLIENLAAAMMQGISDSGLVPPEGISDEEDTSFAIHTIAAALAFAIGSMRVISVEEDVEKILIQVLSNMISTGTIEFMRVQ